MEQNVEHHAQDSVPERSTQNIETWLKGRNVHTCGRNVHTCEVLRYGYHHRAQDNSWTTDKFLNNCVVCQTTLVKYVMISGQIDLKFTVLAWWLDICRGL